nr:N-6 DNA methylase [Candidatus Sigynarchaeum springense]
MAKRKAPAGNGGEARIHFELFYQIRSAIEEEIGAGLSPVCVSCEAEVPVLTLSADLVLYDKAKRPVVVIEAKRLARPDDPKSIIRDIDPFSPSVIRQAVTYAANLGARYCATYNGKKLHFFETFKEFTAITSRKTKSYRITDLKKFCKTFVHDIDNLIEGKSIWDLIPEAVASRFGELHSNMVPSIVKAFKKAFEDEGRKNVIETWIKKQGWSFASDKEIAGCFANLSRQAAYLLIDRILFYILLSKEPAYSSDVPRLILPKTGLKGYLMDRFAIVIEKVDFAAIYELDPVFDSFDYSGIEENLRDFVDELNLYDFPRIKENLVGILYDKVIPPEERHAMGQYYTPPIVCDLICQLVIKNADAKIMDPACGSGGFLISGYNRLKQLKHDEKKPATHKQLLDQIYGVEINRFPAHLSAINLSLQDLGDKTDELHIEISDFFDVEPGSIHLTGTEATADGDGKKKAGTVHEAIPAKLDAIVGNPPYIRQEKIVDKSKIRRHLDDIDKKALVSEFVDETSDIYVYFFTHATQWLSDTGKLGFITSERYLDTNYGTGLMKFFLRNFRVNAVIGFEKHIFEDAVIGTVITILEREKNPGKRNENFVRFLRIKKKMNVNDIEAILAAPRSEEVEIVHNDFNLVVKQQQNLAKATKWRKYLFAPSIFFELASTPHLVELNKIADIKRGITSGANCFFYRRDEEFTELESTFPGLKRYFKPLLKAIGQSDWLTIRSADTDWHVLDVHPLIQEIQEEADKTKEVIEYEGKYISDTIKKKLRDKGHAVLVKYISAAEAGTIGYCESEHPDKTPTCATRKIWFDLREIPLGGIAFPKEYWTKFICPIIDGGISMDARVYFVEEKAWKSMDPRVDRRKVLAAILNSDLSAIFYEFSGRVYAGQALDRASCMVYEANAMKVIDPRRLETDALLDIQARFQAILDAERDLIPQKTKSTFFEVDSAASEEEKGNRLKYVQLRHALNVSILKAIGMEERADEIQAAVQRIIESRRVRGWADAKVLIGAVPERMGEFKLIGAEEIEVTPTSEESVEDEDEKPASRKKKMVSLDSFTIKPRKVTRK